MSQFLYGSENRVGTTGAKCRVKREMAHQMSGDVFNTRAATEVDTHERTFSLSQMFDAELARA